MTVLWISVLIAMQTTYSKRRLHHSIDIEIEEPYQDNKLLRLWRGVRVFVCACFPAGARTQQMMTRTHVNIGARPTRHKHDFPATHSQATTSGF